MPSPTARPAGRDHRDPPGSERQTALLGLDLTAVGARPGGHGPQGAVAARPFDGERLARLVHRADRGLLDLVVLGDALLLHPGRRQVPGRLDAAVAAARVAPLALRTVLVAGVPHREVEAAHLAAAVRGVQRAGRAAVGWQLSAPAPGADLDEQVWAAHAEAAVRQVDAVWEGAEDVGAVRLDPEGRFHVDHEGVRFAVRGRTAPAHADTTRPVVVVPVSGGASAEVAGRHADVARVTAADPDEAGRLRALVRSAAVAAGRPADNVRVLVDVDVALADDHDSAVARLDLVRATERPDLGAGALGPGAQGPGARGLVLAGTGEQLAALVVDWVRAGAADGVVVRPTSPEADLDVLVERVVPALQGSGLVRPRPAPAGASRTPALADTARPEVTR